MTTVEADRELKAKHRALWASGDYPAVAAELIPEFGPELVRACGRHVRGPRARCGRRLGQRRHPRGSGGRDRHRERPHAGAVRRRPPDRRRSWRRAGMGRGRCGGDAVRGQQFRRGDVLRRRDVRAAPPGHRRRGGPSVPARRHHRDDQLDARGIHRQPVRDDEAVRAAASARGEPGAAMGRRGSRSEVVRRSGHRPDDPSPDSAHGPLRESRRSSASTGSATTARPSRPTGSTRSSPSASRPWTETS